MVLIHSVVVVCTSGGAAGSTAVVGRSWVVPLVVGWTSTIPSRAASDPEVRGCNVAGLAGGGTV